MGKIGCFAVGALVGAGAVALLAVLAEEPLWGGSSSEPEKSDDDCDMEMADEKVVEVTTLPETY